VCMLRAVRFAASLGFSMAAETAAPVRALGEMLREVPPARLYEEILKLFQTGYGVRAFDLLLEYELFRYLFPATQRILDSADGAAARELIRKGLEGTDSRIAADKPVTPMFLFAVLLWPAIRSVSQQLVSDGRNEVEALASACEEIVSGQQGHVSIPKRFSAPMKEIIVMQRRFAIRHGLRAARLLQHKRFRAAYDFLLLRSQVGEADRELAQWWTDVQELSPNEQRDAFELGRSPGGGGRRRRRPRRGGRAGRRPDSQGDPGE
jgi:poly(A) polymerase